MLSCVEPCTCVSSPPVAIPQSRPVTPNQRWCSADNAGDSALLLGRFRITLGASVFKRFSAKPRCCYSLMLSSGLIFQKSSEPLSVFWHFELQSRLSLQARTPFVASSSRWRSAHVKTQTLPLRRRTHHTWSIPVKAKGFAPFHGSTRELTRSRTAILSSTVSFPNYLTM